ncbi:MAG: hypothetical protein IPH59_10575 [bacterium]|nr:hypothetical protein [bacterium]
MLNGDILTDLDFAGLYKKHLDSNAEITIAAYSKRVKIDLGVLETDRNLRCANTSKSRSTR